MLNIKRANFTEGAIFSKMMVFAFPIMITGILQLLYNSADHIIVGRFSGDPNALGAVGCTTSTVNLIVSMLSGFAAGTSVIISQLHGAKDNSELSKATHTVLTTGAIGGVFLLLLGEFVAPYMLTVLNTKPDLFSSSLLYIRIIFLGIPGLAIFNLGAAIERSIGDSKTPLIILTISGILNVLLNLFFVIVLGMSVEGVAIATIISQYASGIAIIYMLKRADGPHQFNFKEIGIDGPLLMKVLRVSIPSAIQTSLFSISTILTQNAINSFTTDEVSGSAIAQTIEGFIYIALNSFYTVTLTFVGQNYGAKKANRVKKSVFYSIIQVAFLGVVLGFVGCLFAKPLTSIYLDPTADNVNSILSASVTRINVIMPFYVFCGLMETFTGFLRGCGYSLTPMISSVFCICVIRAMWVLYVFPLPLFNNPRGLYSIFPISWILASLFLGIMCLLVYRKIKSDLC